MIGNIIVILAGGLGSRFDFETPKQYTKLLGKEVISYSINAAKDSIADTIVVVLNDDIEALRISREYNVEVTIGGIDRAHSFQNAINYIDKTYDGCKNILFHEAARPLVRSELFNKYFELLLDWDYVETCKKITDSLGSYTIQAPRREEYYLIQAPEAYRYDVLKKYYDCDSDIYFAANQFPQKVMGYRNFDFTGNIKLTTKEDVGVIEYLLRNIQMKKFFDN